MHHTVHNTRKLPVILTMENLILAVISKKTQKMWCDLALSGVILNQGGQYGDGNQRSH